MGSSQGLYRVIWLWCGIRPDCCATLLGLTLSVPDHTTLSRRAETLEVPRPRSDSNAEPVHLLVDSTGLKLCGAGEWLIEKHGTRRRRAWRKLHIGVDADTGRIVASELTPHDDDDGPQVGPLLDQVAAPLASFTGDGAAWCTDRLVGVESWVA